MTAHRRYQHACRSAVGVLAAVWAMTAVLAGCAGGDTLNGHPAPSLSMNTPGPPTTSGPDSQDQSATTQPSSSAGTASTLAGTASSSAGTALRPYRPNSVIAGLFKSTYLKPCVYVAAGSSGTAITIDRLVTQEICFTGLGVSAAPSIVVTTPGGTREMMTLTSAEPRSSVWDWLVLSVPGRGPEASLGEYTFRVITAIPGTASSTPTGASPSITTGPPTRFMATSGSFTVIPAAQPSAEVSNAPLPEGSQLQIGFSDFPSFSMVYVSLYGPGVAGRYPLLVDLPGLRTDQYGEGVALWTVPPGSAAGTYAVWIDPPPAGCQNPCTSFSIAP